MRFLRRQEKGLTVMEKIYFMKKEDPEFKRAFQALDDPEARNEEYGEFWQYMGTVKKNGVWVHEFRHRMHPKTKKREYFDVAARFGWEPAECLNFEYMNAL